MNTQTSIRTQGLALVTALIFMVVMLAVLTAYLTMTTTELKTNNISQNGVEGFYAAEGGLNMRAEQVRNIFKGYLRPVGTAPSTAGGALPCVGTNVGSGDMRCIAYTLNGRTVNTYMVDVTNYISGNPESGTVGPGDIYAGLNYAQYAYTVKSEALSSTGKREAVLEMKFQSRLVPLFQFAAFYDDDLEFHPGEDMSLNGRVHTNGSLYLNAESGRTLSVTGKTTAANQIGRYGKDGRGCSGIVTFYTIPMACNGTSEITTAQLIPFNKNVLSHQQKLTVPLMSSLAPDPTGANNSELWSRADVRIVATAVAVTVNPTGFVLSVVNADDSPNTAATAALQTYNSANPLNPAVVVRPRTFWDNREGKLMTLIDVNQQRLMDAIESGAGAFKDSSGNTLHVNDTTGGGLAIHFSFRDGNPATNGSTLYATNYGVRIRNAARLGTTNGLPQLKGLTIITNQSLYTQGDYNTGGSSGATAKRPAALIADAINILSNAATGEIVQSGSTPEASPTTVNAAFLSGIDETKSGAYNGGLQNYPRLHETWGSSRTFTYKGSFVSLGNSLHVQGKQGSARYSAPKRDFSYDTDFNDANNLPPLTPRFVYLRQLLFARSW
ncbi:pilus assembly PilX N-terminal domain-containing protein [Deinococcus aquatilis]|uniref:pilus assembly PilX N-terminal domain-containing protein n=1 Tax=Deinococcus aquatilis TaxID=519440 RepID=UPI0012F9CF63|nr:pilus assembly PilX N-terminal domain-containing protein [Deinococcus aquatilis]